MERPTTVDIELPDTILRGRVLLLGKPQPDVEVFVTGEEGLTTVRSANDGSFKLHALSEGPVQLFAQTATAESPTFSMNITEDAETVQDLALEQRRKLIGTLQRPDGTGLAGVPLDVWPLDSRGSMVRPIGISGDTDLTGGFSISIPKATARVLLVAYPSGFSLIIKDHTVIENEPVILQADQAGGTVRINPGENLPNPPPPGSPGFTLYHDGRAVGLFHLAKWQRMNGSAPTAELIPTELPRMPAGRYAACWIPAQAILPTVFGPHLPQWCGEGTLAPFGETVLSPTAP